MARIVGWFGVALLAFGLAAAAAAQSLPVPAPAGDGVLSGVATLRVKRCGRSELPLALGFAIAEDGRWSADAPVALAGSSSTRLTWKQFYSHFRARTRLALSGASLAALEAELASRASALCRENVGVSALSVSQATLVLNKRWTRAKLRLGARGQGALSAGARALRFHAVASGAWSADE